MNGILFLRSHARLKSRLRAAVMWQMHVINKPSFVVCSFQILTGGCWDCGRAWFYCLLRSYKSTFRLCGLYEHVDVAFITNQNRTEKRCSHNLLNGHPAWWSTDNYSIFPTVNIFRLFRSKKRTGRGNQKCLKNWKNNIMHLCFSCISYLSFGTEMRGKLKRNRARS